MKLRKTMIAERVIRGITPDASVRRVDQRWHLEPEQLRGCDIVVGCMDGFRERWELQVLSRRYLVPLIDIGLDVNTVGDEPPRMAGQVILSVPGGPCMKCMHFITDENLEKEAGRYGDAGVRPAGGLGEWGARLGRGRRRGGPADGVDGARPSPCT